MNEANSNRKSLKDMTSPRNQPFQKEIKEADQNVKG